MLSCFIINSSLTIIDRVDPLANPVVQSSYLPLLLLVAKPGREQTISRYGLALFSECRDGGKNRAISKLKPAAQGET